MHPKPVCPGSWLAAVAAVAALALSTPTLSAQSPVPQLVKDINTTPVDSLPSNPRPQRKAPGGLYGSRFLSRLPSVFLTATTSKTGTEPYLCDGRVNGTVLLGDVRPGPQGSNPQELTVCSDGTKLYFSADDGTSGRELWVCDLVAKPPKCTLVQDIERGPGSSDPDWLAPIGKNRIVFSATRAGTGRELFVSDGTAAGTRLVKDINPGSRASSPTSLRTSTKGDQVFFYATNSVNGVEPWVTDGTPAGTAMIADINPGPGSFGPGLWQDIGDSKTTKMILNGDNSTNGWELWITDGTAANTKMIADIQPGSGNGAWIYHSLVYNGTLYFGGNDGRTGWEMWQTDGTAAGTRRVFDTNPSGSGGFEEPVLVSGKIYFRAALRGTDYELWVHDPAATTNATRLVKDIFPGTHGSDPSDLAPSILGRLFFCAQHPRKGRELFVSDGTALGTHVVADLVFGGYGSDPKYIAEAVPGRLVFNAYDGPNGRELWTSDGTSAGTTCIPLDIGTSTVTRSAFVGYLAEMNGKVFFSAYDRTHGTELWSSDGTAAGTQMVKDLSPGPSSGGAFYNTRLGNRILFTGTTPATGTELFITDGTAAGTKLLKDLMPGPDSSDPADLQRIGDKVYFGADSGLGYEIHVTDGTAAGTRQFADFNPGPGNGYGYIDSRVGLPNGTILQACYSDPTGYELGITDGTKAGTKILDLYPGRASSDPRFLTVFKGKVYFSANTGQGYELHVTDGTAARTKMVVDLVPGLRSSYWYDLTSDGSLLYGYVDSPRYGTDLWASDGTAAGTRLLADIVPGPAGVVARYHAPVGSRHVYFRAETSSIGKELFRWDGRSVRFWDVWPGPNDGSLHVDQAGGGHAVATSNGFVYFRGDNGQVGTELFRLKNGATATNSYPDCGTITLTGTDPQINTTATLDLSNPNRNPITVLLLGLVSPTPIPLSGSTCPFFIDLKAFAVMGTSVKASHTFSFAIPNSTALEGKNLVFQAVDLRGLPKLDASNPLQWTLSSL